MFITVILVGLFVTLVRSAATLKSGVYHLVNLGDPYAPASFDNKNRVVLPEPFGGDYDLWEIVAPPERADTITIKNIRGKKFAQISPPAEGQFVTTGNHPTAFATVLSGTADFPGDDGIPDRYLEYWTIGTPGGLVWTYNNSAGSEVSLQPLNGNRPAGQYWMFATEGSLPFFPRDVDGRTDAMTLSPRLAFPS
ncbi:hypothetical protein C8R46DRAFT_1357978 [Mycena filopes]|nr:hypothetical protein C8R46DRAFT_1357978 [Mycena filopes]